MFDESARFNRIWLRITPDAKTSAIIQRLDDMSDVKIAYDKLSIGASSGDYASLIQGITQGKEDFSWYIPISGELPTYSFTNSFYRQTPDWGQGGRAMADIMGGLAKTAGKALDAIGSIESVKVIGRAGGAAKSLGEFLHTFTGTIDSPKIWEKSDFGAVELSGEVAFESFEEYQYYKAAELVFTVMTMPAQGGEAITTVADIGKKINTSTNGPIRKYILIPMQKPLSECSFEILVGKQKGDLFRQFNKIEIEEDENSLWLFALDSMNLASFSASTTNASGFDERGIPRLLTYGFTFEPQSALSVLSGFKRLAARNKYTKVVDAPILEGETGYPWGDDGGVNRNNGQKIIGMGLQQASIKRIARSIAPNTARALIGNILNANLTAGAALYLTARAYQTIGPVRVLVGANNQNAYIPSGYPGLLKEIGMNIATAAGSIAG